jgi:hypothetical protein
MGLAEAEAPTRVGFMEDVMGRRSCLGIIVGLTVAAGGAVVGCSGEPVQKGELGTLNLPLSTRGPSGTEYRLRNATFQISSSYYYDDYGAGGEGSSGNYTVSSEDDPSASSIKVSVERGYYYVRLLPGWRMEKIENGEATDVVATLLSPATQWIYVYQRSSTWLSYEFGLGERSLWFNGDLTIGVQVYENPDQYYGGEGGAGGAND